MVNVQHTIKYWYSMESNCKTSLPHSQKQSAIITSYWLNFSLSNDNVREYGIVPNTIEELVKSKYQC